MTSCGVSSAAANAEYRCCNRGKLAATSSSAAAPTTTQQRARATIVLFAASSLAALPQVSDPNLFSIHKSECYAVAFHRTALSAAVAELAGYCKSTAKRLQRLTANSGHAKTHSKFRSHVFVDSPASEKRTDEGACVACACAACQCRWHLSKLQLTNEHESNKCAKQCASNHALLCGTCHTAAANLLVWLMDQ